MSKILSLVDGLSPIDAANIRVSLLRTLFFTYLWIPMREKLLNDYKEEKFILRNGYHPSDEMKEAKVEKKPELIDQWLPELGYWRNLYYKLSTTVHVWNLITGSVYLNLDDDNRLQDGKLSFLCYTPRVGLHESIDKTLINYVSVALSLLQLSFRFVIIYLEGHFKFNPTLFLLMDDNSIDRAKDTAEALRTYNKYKALELTQSIMLYKMEDKLQNVVKFRVRPNRTPEVRLNLMKIVGICEKLIIIDCTFVVIIFVPLITYTFLTSPQTYYTGCDEIVPFDMTHLGRAIGSVALCSIIAFDTIAFLFYPLIKYSILMIDLMVYWQHIELILNNHLETILKLRNLNDSYQSHEILYNVQYSRTRSYYYHYHYDSMIQVNEKNSMATIAPKIDNLNLSSSAVSPNVCGQEITEDISGFDSKSEILSIVGDFFEQLVQADKFISVGIGFAFGIWLICNGAVTILDLDKEANFSTFILIRIIQTAGLIILILITGVILNIKRATESAYGTICSIMANDLSIEKRRWVLLLKYYTGKPRHALTIWHSKIFTLGIFLQILSYTFTFGLYLESFRFYNRVNTHKQTHTE